LVIYRALADIHAKRFEPLVLANPAQLPTPTRGLWRCAALLHLGEGRRRRVTSWRRFLPRELQQALKALNPEWQRPRLGALVEDDAGDDRQMQQCRGEGVEIASR